MGRIFRASSSSLLDVYACMGQGPSYSLGAHISQLCCSFQSMELDMRSRIQFSKLYWHCGMVCILVNVHTWMPFIEHILVVGKP